uniref:G-protein coupled receptors family 1 profile domain-containing protein n=1 Tax=Strigamia maritima TaxID=126957 RepID=T1J5K4_STRMM
MGDEIETTLLVMDNLSSTWMMEVEANSTLPPKHDSYYFYKTEQLTFLWIMFTMIVMGNSAVLVALLLSKNKKSRMNFFITHLAIADLSVGLISVLTDVIWKMTVSWLAGNVLCKLIRYLQVTVTYSSTYVLVALSIDRYDAITRPMKFSGRRRAHALVIVAWFLSAVFSIPILVLYEEAEIDGQFQCWIDLGAEWKWQLYLTLITVSLFLIPTLIISACYTIIVITIWSKGKTLTGQPKSAKTKHPADMDSKRASSRGIIPKAKIKTVKMTFVIVFVFVLCWSPYFIYDLLQVYGHLPITPTQNAIATFMQSLAPLNSAANPIIYCLFSTHICRNLR